jgi:hypothetical protein
MPYPQLNRRTLLRAAGVCIGLPLLEAMLPIGWGAEQKAEALRARRMLLVSRPLGYHAPDGTANGDRDGSVRQQHGRGERSVNGSLYRMKRGYPILRDQRPTAQVPCFIMSAGPA